MRGRTTTDYGCPLELSDTYASVKDFLLTVQSVAAERGAHVGYRKLKRVFDRWKWEARQRADYPRFAQDKTMRDDPTGETAIRRIMDELAASFAAA